jgi:hypothetical protein
MSRLPSLVVVCLAAFAPSLALAQTAAPPPPPIAPERHIGIGYKAGNGLLLKGADIIVAPIPHLAFDLQAGLVTIRSRFGDNTKGWGVAPSVQGRLYSGQIGTPYASVGLFHVNVAFGGLTATRNGVFANAGWQWRWPQGFEILLAGGFIYGGKVFATNGDVTIWADAVTAPNFEFGVRYMFL